ncbi:MAG: cytidine deaminase [Elusimicrobiota bacterium]
MIQKEIRKLIDMAKRARRKAYCPYSRYPIGAAVLTDSGKYFSGANVENASYGLSLCAERVAIFNAVTRGAKALRAICVIGRSARPCGACRQVMLEFSAKDTQLITVDIGTDSSREAITRTRMFKMLPNAFDPMEAGLLPPNPLNLLRRKKGRSAPTAARRRRAAHRKRRAASTKSSPRGRRPRAAAPGSARSPRGRRAARKKR